MLIGILFAGGFVWWWNYSAPFVPLVEDVRNKAGVFSLAPALPIPRTESGSTVLDGKFYVVGGLGAWAETLTSFMMYDPKEKKWHRLPDLPEKLHHSALVGAEGKIYVVGGFGPLGIRLRGFMFARWDPRSTLYIFDTKSKTWSKGPPLPEPRGGGAAAIAEQAIWYVGGIAPDLKITPALFRFDILEQKWSEMPPMPTARDHLRMEAVGDQLYAISGRKDDLRFNLAVTERYDIKSRRWSRVADIPLARGGLASVVYQGKIYTFGGEMVWSCLEQIERYDPETDTWTVLGLMPEGRHGIQAGVLENRIHLISGGRRPRISISGIHRMYTPGV